MPNTVQTFVLFMLFGAATAAGQERLMELFLFQSDGKVSALTTDRTGAKLPYSEGGWKAAGSWGDLSDKLGESELARLRSDGYLLLDKEKPRSTRVEDWRIILRARSDLRTQR